MTVWRILDYKGHTTSGNQL